MARIDAFVVALHKMHADAVVLQSGERVTLRSGVESKVVSQQPVTLRQLEDLLQEALPVDPGMVRASGAGREFEYTTDTGGARVVFVRHSGGMRVELTPVEAILAPPPARRPRPRIDALLARMVEARASDLHLSSGSPALIRTDGEITALEESGVLTPEILRDILFEIAPHTNQQEFDATHDTDFCYEMHEEARFRCNVFADRRGIGAVLRYIPGRIPTVQEIGLSKPILDLCHLQKGLVLLTGPTGSGKSTTLAAMIQYINERRCAHIITIEDPIEFVYPNQRCLINQREVGRHTDGFKQALRAALREDPDIVLVGEMRDLETVEIAIETAETGHLVFATLHTNTAPSAVDRMIDQFPHERQVQVRAMLSESLRGVVAQVLLKKRGGGRVAAQEILLVNNAVSNLIREGKTFQIPSIMQTARAHGMITMNDAVLELVRKGTVDADEALAKAPNRAELRTLLERGTARPVPAPAGS